MLVLICYDNKLPTRLEHSAPGEYALTIYRVSCKKVYPALKVNTLHQKYKNIQLNEPNFENYQFFQLMTLEEIAELYLQ